MRPAAIAARLAVATLALLSAPAALAQRAAIAGATATSTRPSLADTWDGVPQPPIGRKVRSWLGLDEARPDVAPLWAPLASLIVPGTGQAAMRQTRGVAYVAAEAYAWVQYFEFRGELGRRRSGFRRLAREVARAPFGVVRDTGWKYYEDLYDRASSGRYNTTPGAALTPETDTSTFNGNQWYQLRLLYFDFPEQELAPSDPRYQRALADYTLRAYKDEFRWSWLPQQLQYQNYKADVERKNQLERDMTMTLVVIGANHLVSAIDALGSVRLRRSRGPAGQSRIEATVPWAPFGRPPSRKP
jgi:hypothetical protein